MPKKPKTGPLPPPPRPSAPASAPAPDPVAQWVETQKRKTASTPDWDLVTGKLLEIDIPWPKVLNSLWMHRAKKTYDAPPHGALLIVTFKDGTAAGTFGLEPGDPIPELYIPVTPPNLQPPPTPPPLGFSPVTTIHTEPAEPTPEALGFSPIHTALTEEPSPPLAAPAPTPGPANTRKRKGKAVSATPYALKRQLDDKEAKKIATAPAVTQSDIPPAVPVVKTPPPPGAPATTRTEPTHTPSHPTRPKTSPPRSKARSLAPTTPDNTTTKHGIVVHGIALRNDLGNVRRWLEASNAEMGKTTGIRWLRKKSILLEEGKKTSSAVVYLETPKDIGKVRLGGRWLRMSQYEPDRGRK